VTFSPLTLVFFHSPVIKEKDFLFFKKRDILDHLSTPTTSNKKLPQKRYSSIKIPILPKSLNLEIIVLLA